MVGDERDFLDDDEKSESVSNEDEDLDIVSSAPGVLASYSEDELSSQIEKDKVEPSPSWMVSMGDVTALMLTFFVMLFSMSELRSEKWDAVISLISTSTRPDRQEQPKPVSELNVDTVSILPALSTDYLNRIYQRKLAADPVLAGSAITALPDRMIISLPSDVLFRPGSAVLTPAAPPVIAAMSGVLAQVGNQVEIVGHTDPVPPPLDGPYPTNWELSLARSVTVANALNEAGYAENFVALGMADSRFRFLDPSIPENRRYELARRIDIVILSDAGGQ